MTSENEIAMDAPGQRVNREISRWIGNNDFSTRPKDVEALRDAGNHVNWLRALPFFLLHAACLGVIWVGVSWFAFGAAVFMYVIRMFAITGFYHRYFSHRTFKTSRVAQFIFGVWGATAVQRGPIWWAAHHRHHHVHADKIDDVHSPVQHGFWWSHMLWFLSDKHFAADLSRVKDLLKFPELRFLDRFDVVVPSVLGAAVFSLGMVLERFAPGLGTTGWQLLVWAFFISTVALYHGTYTINSLSHVFGSRRYRTDDDSRNNPLLAVITLGEGWHNNHHHYPASVRQGFYWWEFDFTFYILKAMSFCRLVWDLKPVPAAVREGGAKRL